MNALERAFGGRWCGISFFGLDVACKDDFTCPTECNACEALDMASTDKILLKPCGFSCPGARYAFGCGGETISSLSEWIGSEHGLSREYARSVAQETPRCEVEAGAIGIGVQDDPELWISRLQPVQVMELVRAYQSRFERAFRPDISTVASVCGTVIVGALKRQDMTMALGSSLSRDSGYLTRDRMLVGLPAPMARELAH